MSTIYARCVKCGCTTATRVYRESGPHRPECLLLTCIDCGYSWTTPTLDRLEDAHEAP